MVIDVILDRKDGEPFDPKSFRRDMVAYGEISSGILAAFDKGSNSAVQFALCDYIDRNGYNPDIKKYVNSQDWVVGEKKRQNGFRAYLLGLNQDGELSTEEEPNEATDHQGASESGTSEDKDDTPTETADENKTEQAVSETTDSTEVKASFDEKPKSDPIAPDTKDLGVGKDGEAVDKALNEVANADTETVQPITASGFNLNQSFAGALREVGSIDDAEALWGFWESKEDISQSRKKLMQAKLLAKGYAVGNKSKATRKNQAYDSSLSGAENEIVQSIVDMAEGQDTDDAISSWLDSELIYTSDIIELGSKLGLIDTTALSSKISTYVYENLYSAVDSALESESDDDREDKEFTPPFMITISGTKSGVNYGYIANIPTLAEADAISSELTFMLAEEAIAEVTARGGTLEEVDSVQNEMVAALVHDSNGEFTLGEEDED